MALASIVHKRNQINRATRTAPQALTGAGAVNHTACTTLVTTSGVGQALTLADGTAAMIGFRKRIIHAVRGGGTGTAVLTDGAALNLGPGTIASITLTTVRQWTELEWDGTNWNIIGGDATVA